ncbi:SLC13 family permease [Alteromonas sp. a30]|uniref:SLC13 family permease n=1 Tax=Alteromonas sp. a30 TaxID=2730917 RepID=UPI00227E1A57|nr:SLC13 family permease [Alteromonas sp. a30]MCY7295882.1 SLC13 family permease [Alteromonas sp. a30]
MDFNAVMTLLVFFSTIGALIFSNRNPSFIFSMATLVLLISQQLTISDVFHNLANQGLVTLVLLLVISVAIDKTGFIKSLGRKLVTANATKSLARLLGASFFSSALLNNTAVVASLIGPVKQNQHHPASKLLLPLSYAAILGGTVTLIGTSTNLIVDSFLVEHGHQGFAFWDFTLYGLSAGIACCLLLFAVARYLPQIEVSKDQYKHYFIEAKVAEYSSLIGKSIEENHLRNLPELFLVEVVRENKLISPVSPELVIEANDILIFSGNVQRMDTLNHIDGLTLFADNIGLLKDNLTEVIISNRSMLLGRTLKNIGFRALFDAAVVAIRRDGETLSGKLGEIKLRAGDALLLATGPDFQNRNNLKNNFFIVSEVNLSRKLTRFQEASTIGGFIGAIACSALFNVPLTLCLLVLLALLVTANVINGNEIKRSLPVNLIAIIVGALSLALSLEKAGLINQFTQSMTPILANSSPFVALLGVYLATWLLTELVTNNAAAALMFPFAYGISESLGLPIMPFALAVAFAASASFISPYGYQTNLLVFSAGNYRFSDFIKSGVPVSILYSAIILVLLKMQYGL